MTPITQEFPTWVNIPTTSNPTNFDAYADNWIGVQLVNFVTAGNVYAAQMNVLAGEVNAASEAADDSADAAAASAVAAATSAGQASDYADDAAAVVNFAGAWSALVGELSTPASVEHNGTVWILLNFLPDVTASEPGVSADWIAYQQFSVVARTSNTVLGPLDISKILHLSTSFTQTFAAAATLRNGWFVYIKNTGTGSITLDPNASELIDGLSSFVMYPGEMRLVYCTGTALITEIINVFEITYLAGGTFTPPPGYAAWQVGCQGAGGGGGSGQRTNGGTNLGGGGGGGGGAYIEREVPISETPSAVTVTVGTGGAGGTARTTDGNGNAGSAGGETSFGSLVVALGGNAGAGGNASASAGGDHAVYQTGRTATHARYVISGTGGAGSGGTSGIVGDSVERGGAGGGSGGGTATPAHAAAGSGGARGFGTGAGGGSTNGQAGTAATRVGGGGGGGAGGNGVAGGNGGAAALGGGGGGGGACNAAFDSGAGAPGGNGYVLVRGIR